MVKVRFVRDATESNTLTLKHAVVLILTAYIVDVVSGGVSGRYNIVINESPGELFSKLEIIFGFTGASGISYRYF
jgi:hypothetical protein